MAKIISSIKDQAYKVEITSASGNTLIADEPEALGGQNLGFSPKELLGASLAACTSATLKMYAQRKKWDLQEVKIDIELEFDANENKTHIRRDLEFIGELDATQIKRLLQLANKCPIHKILENTIEIHTKTKS